MYREDSRGPGAGALGEWVNRLRVATPCPARWEDMLGDERARECLLCDRKVYDTAKLTREEIFDLVAAAGDGPLPCLRLWRRSDGTVITADCTYGQSLRRRRRLRVLGAAAGAMLAVAGIAASAQESAVPIAKIARDGDRFDGDGFLQGYPRPAPPEVPDRVMIGELGAPLMGLADIVKVDSSGAATVRRRRPR